MPALSTLRVVQPIVAARTQASRPKTLHKVHGRATDANMQRRHFVTLVAGAIGSASFMPVSARCAQTVNFSAPLRVHLFAGLQINRLAIGADTFDAASKTFSTGNVSQTIGNNVVAVSANPYLDVNAFSSDGSQIVRRYTGTLFAQVRGAVFYVVNEVDVETYVASVMSAEVSPGWPTESLRAQAIAVRTYAARSRLLHASSEYDLNDDTSSQVYRGIDDIAPSLAASAHDTAGQIVVWNGAPASVFYSSSCGGHTASSMELTGQPAPPYLNGISDTGSDGRPYCENSPYFRWKNSVATPSMARVVDTPANQLTSVTVTERWPDGRVKTVVAAGSSFSVSIDGREFYSRALSMLGYKVIPSSLFDISRDGDGFALLGHGVGHGVGMCQWGARGRADVGMNASQILQAYFPGTSIAVV